MTAAVRERVLNRDSRSSEVNAKSAYSKGDGVALALRRLARDVFDFCYPGRCAACEASCETANALCDKCDRALNVLESAAACGACGMPAAGPGGPCAYCQGQGFGPYERVLRVGLFRDPLKHLIHEMKYRGRWPI